MEWCCQIWINSYIWGLWSLNISVVSILLCLKIARYSLNVIQWESVFMRLVKKFATIFFIKGLNDIHSRRLCGFVYHLVWIMWVKCQSVKVPVPKCITEVHFTDETESLWPLHFKHSHWWKRRSRSNFASHSAWGANRVCECKVDVDPKFM
jgi:hypothetical protein